MAKKTRRVKTNSSKKNKIFRGPSKKSHVVALFIALGVLFLLLLLLLLKSFGYIDDQREERYYPVVDQCSLVRGNLLHQIRTAGECRIGCVNECDVRELEFVNYEFEAIVNDCNICGCYCK